MKIWVDIDNPPHVHFFTPIIRHLIDLNHHVDITIRDYAYTRELLEMFGIEHLPIGRHYGRQKLLKVVGLGARSYQLASFAWNRDFDVAVSHGSRSLPPACWLLDIPCLTIYDYEYVSSFIFNRFSTKVMLPDAIPVSVGSSIGVPPEKLIRYPGLKEEVYLSQFIPDNEMIKELKIDDSKVVVTFRPPATMAHYHSRRTEELFYELLNFLTAKDDVELILLPRTPSQKIRIFKIVGDGSNIKIPSGVVDGPNLIWHSDLVVGAGGTMNREAAVLRVPAYSIFSGKKGAVDTKLEKEGKLTFIRSAEDFEQIKFKKRVRTKKLLISSNNLVDFFVNEILKTACYHK